MSSADPSRGPRHEQESPLRRGGRARATDRGSPRRAPQQTSGPPWIVRLFAITMAMALSWSTPTFVADESPLEVTVYPRTCGSPCTIRVTVRIERHASNRAFVLELDSWSYFRSSVIPLDGHDAARIHEREFESLPAGTYEVRVTLMRSPQQRIHRSESVKVVGVDGPR